MSAQTARCDWPPSNVALCGGPTAKARDQARPWRPVRSSSGLADQLVVLGVRPDPEPEDAVGCFHSYRAIVNAHARRIEAPNLLEVKRGVPRVVFELLEAAVGEALDRSWQQAIALPELRRGVVNQSFVVRPEAWAFNA